MKQFDWSVALISFIIGFLFVFGVLTANILLIVSSMALVAFSIFFLVIRDI